MADAVIGPLEAMPFADAVFDTVICNAVLEHVRSADKVFAELARVLRPGGHMMLAVPFLQPFHPCPGDYRRYTQDGLADLANQAGLTVIAAHPVHSAAQTLGWIAWEIALEKNSRLLRGLIWPLIYVATRLSLRTDKALVRNANTYQVVFARP